MNRCIPLFLLVILSPWASGQQASLLGESFDYTAGNLGGMDGGEGWGDAWWSGNNQDAAIVVLPGLDSVGGLARTNVEHSPSYRALNVDQYAWLKDPNTGTLGKDGTTIWISFDCQRTPGGDDFYGGLHLNRQWAGHQLFIGSPWGDTKWGFEKNFVGAPVEVANSNCDVQTRLVVRLDFEPGDDLVSLWLDPATDYPTTPADAFSYMPEIFFNEIYLQSGDAVNGTGFDFDNLVIAAEADGPRITVENLIAGRYTTLRAFNCQPGHAVFFAYSLFGGGPTTTPFGNALLSQPFEVLPVTFADTNGVATLLKLVPLGTNGIHVWLQALDYTRPANGALSDGFDTDIQ